MSILTRGLGSYTLNTVVQQVELVDDIEFELEELEADFTIEDLTLTAELEDIVVEVELEASDG